MRGATAAGFATFNFDRIGLGASDRLVAARATIQSNSWVVHQLVQMLRRGSIGGTPFSRVVLTGHSEGSLIATDEAARFDDADAVVVSGYTHAFNDRFWQVIASMAHPAQSEPRFADYPPGWVTTRPGARGLFYHLPAADPTVADVRVPVLLLFGGHDFFCVSAECRANEKQLYRSTPSLTEHLIADAGHNLNRQRSAPETFRFQLDWIAHTVGVA